LDYHITNPSFPVAKTDLTIVIPVKNEEGAIGHVIDELHQEGYTNILVVDGYSTDRTAEVAKSKPGVVFIQQHGKGKTGAVKTAIEHVTTPYMLIVDGDYTYPAKDIQNLLAHCSSYAQVIGVREKTNISPLHRFGNKIITSTFNLLFGAHISDVCSGMYLLNTQVARELELSSKGFITEVEIASQTAAHHNIADVPIGYRERIGKSKLSAINGFGILTNVIKLSMRHNPIFFFSAVASLTIIPGVGILGWVLYQQYLTDSWHSGWALIGVLLTLFATQTIAVAAISALMKRAEQRITQRLNHS
jgi:glycosyltransferase involved in cell wall biosynthesis